MAPRQNRVDPNGDLHAVAARGAWTGNRGVLHDASQRIVRRHQTKRWIVCTLSGPRRQVMTANRWTELFFMDEATAFAAGHRPCFFCRRADAEHFARLWAGGGDRARADEIDRVLHAERQARLRPDVATDELPVGVMLAIGDQVFVTVDGGVRAWSFDGFGARQDRPATARLITPPSTVRVLAAGYPVQVDASAGTRSR